MPGSFYWILGTALAIALLLLAFRRSRGQAVLRAPLLMALEDDIPLAVPESATPEAERQEVYVQWLQKRERTLTDSHNALLSMLQEASDRLGSCAELAGPNQAVQAELDQIHDLLTRGQRQIRISIFPVSALPSDGLDLRRALEQLIASAKATTPVVLEASIDPTLSYYLTDDRKSLVLQVVREALTNAVQHSGANRLSLRAEVEDRRLVIRVADDGVGFNPKAARERGSRGITTMQSRAEAARGLLQVESAHGAGTIVTLTIPLEWQLRAVHA